MNISDGEAWEKARTFITGNVERARKRESFEKFVSLALDPHFSNCIEWLKKLEQSPITAVLISTYGHDLDRALVNRVRKEKYPNNYEAYKRDHAAHSAHVLCTYLARINASQKLIEDVSYLVRNHDSPFEWVGKTPERTLGLVLVKSADALSFFDVNFDVYMKEKKGTITDVTGKMDFMYKKMCGRAFEEMENKSPRKVSSLVQREVRSRIEEIQTCAEQMVLQMYRKALDKVQAISQEYDPRKDTARRTIDPS